MQHEIKINSKCQQRHAYHLSHIYVTTIQMNVHIQSDMHTKLRWRCVQALKALDWKGCCVKSGFSVSGGNLFSLLSLHPITPLISGWGGLSILTFITHATGVHNILWQQLKILSYLCSLFSKKIYIEILLLGVQQARQSNYRCWLSSGKTT